jgi:protein involved in plasmid replication-relaxation
MSRYSRAALVRLADEMSPRRRELLAAVAELRLVSARQLQRRFYGGGASAQRLARMDLAALHDRGVLYRLQRRIGGSRAGSSGFVYTIGSVGQRLLELESGEGTARPASRYEPSLGFLEHALAVSEIYVGLHEHLNSRLTMEPGTTLDFRVEQRAWRRFPDVHGATAILMKPDAELRLFREGFEERWWLEVDRATERRVTLRRQLDAYIAYYRSGQEQQRHGIFPLTAWLTVSEARAEVLREVIAELPKPEQRLFRVGLLSAASPFLLSQGGGRP